jgi:uncharacterized damage-inducible protein DinB
MLFNYFKRNVVFAIGLFLLMSLTFISAEAQSNNSNAVATDFLNIYNSTTDKAAQLAGEIPDNKYDWRPAEGIRSIREAILHVASGNYYFSSVLGAEIPDGVDPRSMEQSGMSKDEAISALKESIAFVQNTVHNMTEEDFETKVDFFGNEVTKRQVMFTLGDHTAEHLGQLIAYARMNDVVPPWSQ